jgi:hypothetical protein
VLLVMSPAVSHFVTPTAAPALVLGTNLGSAINPLLKSGKSAAERRRHWDCPRCCSGAVGRAPVRRGQNQRARAISHERRGANGVAIRQCDAVRRRRVFWCEPGSVWRRLGAGTEAQSVRRLAVRTPSRFARSPRRIQACRLPKIAASGRQDPSGDDPHGSRRPGLDNFGWGRDRPSSTRRSVGGQKPGMSRVS